LVLTRRCSGNRGESVTCPPVWRQPFVTGVGASGAIFGIYGAIGSWLMVRHRSIPAHAGAPLAGGLVAIVGYNLVFGFFQQNVDVAAHVGGLAAGFVAGSLLAASLTEATGWIGARAALVAIAGLVAIGALASRLPKVDGIRQVLTRLGDAERKANSEFERLAAELQQGQITPEAFARSVSDTVLPHWTAARDELARMRAGREQQTVTEIVSYMSMREDAIRLAAQAATSGDVSLMNAARQRRTEADALALTLTSRAKGARPSNPTARAASLAGTVRDAAVPSVAPAYRCAARLRLADRSHEDVCRHAGRDERCRWMQRGPSHSARLYQVRTCSASRWTATRRTNGRSTSPRTRGWWSVFVRRSI
jgi:hypothetical protein